MNLVKKGNIPEAEDSFKEAASLADSVVDEIAKDVIQTQVNFLIKAPFSQNFTIPHKKLLTGKPAELCALKLFLVGPNSKIQR